MKTLNSLVSLTVVAFALACSSGEGEGGTTAQECSGHGTAHDGHCHCDEGYLYDGTTCVGPSEITTICEEHEEPDAGADAGESDAAEEHEHTAACLCPSDGACPCDHGEVQTLGGKSYCVPNLHE